MPYDMAPANLLDSMMFEKTIEVVTCNIGVMNEAAGGISFPPLIHPINNERH